MVNCINKQSSNDKNCDLSIVIPILNELHNLPRLIENLKNQKTKYSYEIVLGDSNSTDGTYEFIKDQDGVRIVNAKERGISKGRNFGIKNTNSPFIIMTDADTIVPNDWVEKYGDAFFKDNYDLVGGRSDYDTDNKTIQKIMSVIGMGDKKVKIRRSRGIDSVTFSGHHMGFSRKLFDELDGFNEDMKWGEDTDFSQRAHKNKNKINYIFDFPVITSVRRFGNTIPNVLEGVFKSALRSGLYQHDPKYTGIVGYDRVDSKEKSKGQCVFKDSRELCNIPIEDCNTDICEIAPDIDCCSSP